MPIISNKLGKGATIRYTATGNTEINALSVPYGNNLVGTVALTAGAAATVTGTGTTFDTDFAVGDYVSAVVNSTVTEQRVINIITSNTVMNVTSAWSAANASTTYKKSETIDYANIRSVKFSSNGSWTIARGANTMMVLHGTDQFDFAEDGQSLSEDNRGNIAVTLSASGSGVLIIEVGKKSRVSNSFVTVI
jgi:hypothetical protein